MLAKQQTTMSNATMDETLKKSVAASIGAVLTSFVVSHPSACS